MGNKEIDINRYALKNMSDYEMLLNCAKTLIYYTKISRLKNEKAFIEGTKILNNAYVEIDPLVCPEYLIRNALGKNAAKYINVRENILALSGESKEVPSIDYVNSLNATDRINITLMAHGIYKYVYLDNDIFVEHGLNISNAVQIYNKNHAINELKNRVRPIFHRLLGENGEYFYGLKIKSSNIQKQELRKFIDSYNKINTPRNHLKSITEFFYTVVNNYYLPRLNLNDNRDIHQINKGDIIIRGYIFKCMHGNHSIKNIDAIVDIDINGEIEQVKIPAGYCEQCNIYFILDSTYQKLKKKGIILCRITDEKVYMKGGSVNGTQLAQESILMQYGYNVSQTEGLTAMRRQKILAVMIDNKILSKSEIISYLDFFISQRSSMPNMGIAISKWEDDREFVENYRVGHYSKFGVNAIHRK